MREVRQKTIDGHWSPQWEYGTAIFATEFDAKYHKYLMDNSPTELLKEAFEYALKDQQEIKHGKC